MEQENEKDKGKEKGRRKIIRRRRRSISLSPDHRLFSCSLSHVFTIGARRQVSPSSYINCTL